MNEEQVREHLTEVRKELAQIDALREPLLALVKGYEGWLRLLQNGSAVGRQIPFAEAQPGRRRQRTPKGSISITAAIAQVLHDAHGEPLHVKEIWRRAVVLGARSDAKNVEGITDLTCHRIKEAERVEPRTWRWVEEKV